MKYNTDYAKDHEGSLNGWLSPDAKFYPCEEDLNVGSYELFDQAMYYMLDNGWIKCGYSVNLGLYADWYSGPKYNDPTESQRNFLLKNGYCDGTEFMGSGLIRE